MTTNFKPRPKLLEKRQQRADVAKIDREENAKVKQRSGGRCEVLTLLQVRYGGMPMGKPTASRCPLRALHVHHLIGGIGRRNRGASILHTAKLHVCDRCHSEIHGHVLVPVNSTEREAAATVRYERVR